LIGIDDAVDRTCRHVDPKAPPVDGHGESEGDRFVVFGDQVGSIGGAGELGILTGQVLVGYPAGAGAEPSDVDRNVISDDLCEQVL